MYVIYVIIPSQAISFPLSTGNDIFTEIFRSQLCYPLPTSIGNPEKQVYP